MRTNKLLQFLLIIVLLTGTAAAQERTWKTFTPEDGSWSILAPGEMKPDAEALATPSKQGSYSFTDAGGFFTIVYQDNPKWLHALWKPFINSHYNKIRKGFVKSAKGKLLKEQKFKNGDISGREVWVQIPDGSELNAEGQLKKRYRVERFRMFFKDARFYIVMAVLPENEINAPAVDRFLDSFTFK